MENHKLLNKQTGIIIELGFIIKTEYISDEYGLNTVEHNTYSNGYVITNEDK